MPADLAVIGLGHFGLPLAQAATSAGIGVFGYDTDQSIVDGLNAGRPAIDGLSAADVRRMVASGFRASADPAGLARARTAVICTPTALGDDRTPDLTAVGDAARTLATQLRPHSTVILESPACPGTTEEYLRPILEEGSGMRAGRDFHLAYSPSRLDPGNRAHTIANTPKVIGGLTPACTEAAAAFYSRICERVVRTRGTREAEAVKLMETNYRHVNIALANEMAVFCHDAGIDLWDVIRCAETKPFGFHAFRPGPGVGGHSIPLDPNRLPYPGRLSRTPGEQLRQLRMVELAREVNDGMPRYVVQRCAALLNEHGKSVRGARVLLLGVTYKADLGDQEGAPAREIGARLLELGAVLSYHDPYVPEWRVHDRVVERTDSLWEAAADADLTVLLQHHHTYDLQGLAVKAQLLLDTRGAAPAGVAARL
jgi:nucleotide sugar dehydrogenase